MNDKLWIVETPDNPQMHVTCEMCGVAQDGSLLCFNLEQTPQGPGPQVIRGFCPGAWRTFYRSTIRSN